MILPHFWIALNGFLDVQLIRVRCSMAVLTCNIENILTLRLARGLVVQLPKRMYL